VTIIVSFLHPTPSQAACFIDLTVLDLIVWIWQVDYWCWGKIELEIRTEKEKEKHGKDYYHG
jgi:hypothetical protein